MTPLPHNRTARTLAIALAGLVLALAAVHAFAYFAWRASFGAGNYEYRLAAAETAAAVEPFVPAYRARPEWVRGEEYLRRNQVYSAFYHLHRASDIDNSDPRLRTALHEANRAWDLATTWKAHVQHGRELTGGVLPEQDVIK
jgi:hypothetical protein